MAKNATSFSEKLLINDYLSNCIEIITVEPATCRYKNGFSDEKVAEAMSFTCTKHNVAGIRKEIYGNLEATGPDKGVRIVAIEERISKLEDVVRNLIKIVNGLASVKIEAKI